MTTKRGGTKKSAKSKRSASAASVAKAPVGKNPTVEMVRQLARIVDTHGLTELKVESEIGKVTLRRGHAAPMPVVQAAPTVVHAAPGPGVVAEAFAPDSAPLDDAHVVSSPFVGTFYRSPNPDSAPYAQIGDHVERGTVLCIVEAMKLMNEIEADQAGKIASILVEDGEPVEYGQPLFRITPA